MGKIDDQHRNPNMNNKDHTVGQPRTCQPFLWAESESGEEEDGEGHTGQQDGG